MGTLIIRAFARIRDRLIHTPAIRAYLRRWWNFCHQNQMSLITPEIPEVIKFLQLEFDPRNTNTIFCSQSAISLILQARLTKIYYGIHLDEEEKCSSHKYNIRFH